MAARNEDVDMSPSASGSGDDSSSSDEEQVESMLATRTKRTGAHNKFRAAIAQYLEVEDVEESYHRMFGEKLDENEDSDDFEQESSSDEDSADSDFSDSEPDDDQGEETKEQAVLEEEGEQRRKRKQQMKSALNKGHVRRPKPKPPAPKPAAAAGGDSGQGGGGDGGGDGGGEVNVGARASGAAPLPSVTDALGTHGIVGTEDNQRRSSRSYSVRDRTEKQKAHQDRKKVSENLAKKRKPLVKPRKVTQAERLEAAKETEKINIAALDYYTKLELERKKKRAIKKRTIPNPVRFRSTTVKTIPDSSTNVEERESREFITFGDVNNFPGKYFDQSRPEPERAVCAITGAPAKFFDPVTEKPYATMAAFRTLRAQLATGEKPSP